MNKRHKLLALVVLVTSMGLTSVQAELSPWPYRGQQAAGILGILSSIGTTIMREQKEKDVEAAINALRAHGDAFTVNTYSPSELLKMQLKTQHLFDAITESAEPAKDRWQIGTWAGPVAAMTIMLFSAAMMKGNTFGAGVQSSMEGDIMHRTFYLRYAQWIIAILAGVAFLALSTMASGKEPAVRKAIEALRDFVIELGRRDPSSITAADSARIHELLQTIQTERAKVNTYSRWSSLVLFIGVVLMTVLSFYQNHSFPCCTPLGGTAKSRRSPKDKPNSRFDGDDPATRNPLVGADRSCDAKVV